jgi:hypothetical protein
MRIAITFLIVSLCRCLGAAVLFDGVNDILGFGTLSDAIYKENSAVTYSAWFIASSDGEANAGIFARKGQNILKCSSPHAVRFTVGGGTVLTRLTSNDAWVTNIWNHLIMTWDGSTNAANCHIYVNGVEASYATTTNGQTPTDNAADSLTIGNDLNTANTFDGRITEVAMYTNVVTAADINKLAFSRTADFPLMCSILPECYWKLNDFTDGATITGVGSIIDSSGKGHHGNPTNSPVAKAEVVITGP